MKLSTNRGSDDERGTFDFPRHLDESVEPTGYRTREVSDTRGHGICRPVAVAVGTEAASRPRRVAAKRQAVALRHGHHMTGVSGYSTKNCQAVESWSNDLVTYRLITLREYLDAIAQSVSRQQAAVDLAAAGLHVRGHGRGARWVRRISTRAAR